MSGEGYMKSIPDFLLCQSMYHHPRHEKGVGMQSWLCRFEEGRFTIWRVLSLHSAALSGPLIYTERYPPGPTLTCSLSSLPQMGNDLMVCFCCLLSKMPWTKGSRGFLLWVQAWLTLWTFKFGDLWMKMWREKKKGKEKQSFGSVGIWLAERTLSAVQNSSPSENEFPQCAHSLTSENSCL